jgi:hypothetical protein
MTQSAAALPLPDQWPSGAIMWRKFESRFKRRDESSVNVAAPPRAASANRAENAAFSRFLGLAYTSLTVAISSPLTIGRCEHRHMAALRARLGSVCRRVPATVDDPADAR